ncbi:hypothetical protein MLD38_020534 [Melastoma candidum]|uniref:Uncharacterized protein n=1 Tax=Melastoma candidum TaxID=119954 RepID=A0ACB9QCN3_9MYRT|nr:hypothetical protein MLD38_020534 [Melastoma candidum]
MAAALRTQKEEHIPKAMLIDNRADRVDWVREYCEKKGHLKDKCFYLVGFPPSTRSRRGRFNFPGRGRFVGRGRYGGGSGGRFTSETGRRNINTLSAGVEENKAESVATHLGLSKEQVQRLLAMLDVGPSNKGVPEVLQGHDKDYQAAVNNIPFSHSSSGKTLTHHNILSALKLKTQNHQKAHWYLDTGATDHVVSDLALFDSFIELQPPLQIQLPNNSKVLSTLNSNLVLTNFLFVPSFQFNLVSVSKLISEKKLSHFLTKSLSYTRLGNLEDDWTC